MVICEDIAATFSASFSTRSGQVLQGKRAHGESGVLSRRGAVVPRKGRRGQPKPTFVKGLGAVEVGEENACRWCATHGATATAPTAVATERGQRETDPRVVQWLEHPPHMGAIVTPPCFPLSRADKAASAVLAHKVVALRQEYAKKTRRGQTGAYRMGIGWAVQGGSQSRARCICTMHTSS